MTADISLSPARPIPRPTRARPVLDHFSRTDAEPGAVRSYTAVRGRFVVSLWSRGKRTERGAWSVYDRLTDARVKCWNRKEAVQTIVSVCSRVQNSDPRRFIILPRQPRPWAMEDVVVVDRVTGRWWWRHAEPMLHEDLRLMLQLAQSLPDDYCEPSWRFDAAA
jgi:hypothetical protein